MTEAEFNAMPEEVKSQLKGANWFLVETSKGSGQFSWLSLHFARRGVDVVGARCYYFAGRFVEG